MDSESLKKRLRISIFQLDRECAEQPELYLMAGELAADARTEAEKAKVRYELAKAKVEEAIRLNPDQHTEISKITDSVIKALVTSDEIVQERQDDWIKARKDADDAQVLKDAFDQKRSMLKQEVDLWCTNYWEKSGMESVGGDKKKMDEKIEEEVKEGLVETKRRRRAERRIE